METNRQSRKDRTGVRRFWQSRLGAVASLLVLEGILVAAWAMTRAAPPETILLKNHQQFKMEAEEALAAEKKRTREAKEETQTQLRLKEARYASLKKKHEDLRIELTNAIRVDRLPKQLQADGGQQTLKNIETLCLAYARVNAINVAALLDVLAEIHHNGTINTALDAEDASRQSLYMQVQILLNAVGAYSGAITGAQAETQAAVEAFQSEHQLKVDGKIGLQTYMGMADLFTRERLDIDGPEGQGASRDDQLASGHLHRTSSD